MKRNPITIAALFLVGAAVLGHPAGATQFRRVTSDSTRETDPAPSPDGKWLAYSCDKGGSTQIWVMPIGGGPARQLTSEPDSLRVPDPDHGDSLRTIIVRATTPTWAPDSKSILFISTRTGRYNIYSVPLEGGKPRRLSDAPGNHRFGVYSPDGRAIAFYSNRLQPSALFGYNIYTMDSGGETPDHLAHQVTNSQGSPGHPTWSPDGAWLAYVSKVVNPDKTVDAGKGMQMRQNPLFAPYKVFKCPAKGGPETRVGEEKAGGKDYEDTWPSWSPADPRWIAVARTIGTKRDVWIIDATTGRSFPLTTTGTSSKPTWSHDGKSIYFTTIEGRNEDVWVATDLTLRPQAAPARSSSAKHAARPVVKKTASSVPAKAAK